MRTTSIKILKNALSKVEEFIKSDKDSLVSTKTHEHKFMATFIGSVIAYCRGKQHLHKYGKKYYANKIGLDLNMYFEDVEDIAAFLNQVLGCYEFEKKGHYAYAVINPTAYQVGHGDPAIMYMNSLMTKDIYDAAKDLLSETPQEYQARKASEHAAWLEDQRVRNDLELQALQK